MCNVSGDSNLTLEEKQRLIEVFERTACRVFYAGIGTCKFCGREAELRMGGCFECVIGGEGE